MKDREALIVECQQYVGDGWADILMRLINDLLELGWDGQVMQVKEKFGGLRFYIGPSDWSDANLEAIKSLIQAAENESLRTCEKCGAPGEPRSEGRHWIKTMCEEHKDSKVWD